VRADERETFEAELRRLFGAGDLRAVATATLEGYGPELFGYLLAILRVEDDAGEVFSELCVELWRDLPRFRWECSMRTWAYTLARHRLSAFIGDPRRARARHTPLSEEPHLAELAQQIRSTTAAHLRTDKKDEVRRLRESLDAEEQTLLILRVDRGLAWSDVAQIMGDANEAALRKRFERTKDRLRNLARDAGLVST
jgi:RNA polymerase sigma-70 factor, ECF subfamily